MGYVSDFLTRFLPRFGLIGFLSRTQLWDVCSDQEAVDLVRNVQDPQDASKMLVDYALGRFSSDNLSCMIVRLDPTGKFPGLKNYDGETGETTESAPAPSKQ